MGDRNGKARGVGDNGRDSSTPHPVPRASPTVFRTPWGWMGLAVSKKGVCRIVLPRPSRKAVESELNCARSLGSMKAAHALSSALREARSQIEAYLRGHRQAFAVPLDLSRGTPFQRRVWKAALRIPFGRVRSYQWIATKLGGTQYARAVGTALGANPVPLIVPCHRVLAHDGSLGGFSGGLPIKRKLLRLEGTLKRLKM